MQEAPAHGGCPCAVVRSTQPGPARPAPHPLRALLAVQQRGQALQRQREARPAKGTTRLSLQAIGEPPQALHARRTTPVTTALT